MTFKELRKMKKIRQEKLADLVGCKQSTVSMWESGKATPKTKDLPIIAKALGVSVTTLVKCFGEQSDEM